MKKLARCIAILRKRANMIMVFFTDGEKHMDKPKDVIQESISRQKEMKSLLKGIEEFLKR